MPATGPHSRKQRALAAAATGIGLHQICASAIGSKDGPAARQCVAWAMKTLTSDWAQVQGNHDHACWLG